MALLADSPALDTGDPLEANRNDQRGLRRTGGVNIGAYQASATTLIVGGFPSPISAGTSASLTVTARDPFGNMAVGYRGTIHFASSDAQALLPANYTFTAADNGVHTFRVTLNTLGTQSITVTDTVAGTLTGTQTAIQVTSVATVIQVAGFPSPVTAGVAGNITVILRDANGSVVSGYRGVVRITSSDGQATLPANYTFTTADGGVHIFSVILRTAGAQSITVTDTGRPALNGTQAGIQVISVASVTQVAGFPSLVTAGVAGNVTVTLRDGNGNIATGYRGTVRFTSSDGQATLPGNYTFTAADSGIHIFNVTLKTSGTHSITVTDVGTPALTGTQGGIQVTAAGVSILQAAGFPSPITAGIPGNFTVTAKDAFGNLATGYRGTVRFTSSDGQASLPGNYVFTAADGGVHTFSVTLRTVGSQSITATDTTMGTLTGTQGSIQVTPAGANALNLAGFPSPITAGVPGNLTVTAKDPFGNVVSGYRGVVRITSSDGQASLPGNYAFTAADGGVHSFSVILRTAGPQSITVTDTGTPALSGTQAGIQVISVASVLQVAGFPASVTAGVAGNVTVTLRDGNGNVATSYRGTVRFTSSDGQATLPGNYTFTAADSGVHTFSVTLKTAPTQSITVTDTGTPALSGTQAGIQVTAAGASSLQAAGFPSPITAGIPGMITITARDAYGNAVTGYRGTVHFTSNDSQAALPANYSFTAADSGVHTFSVTLKTAGSRSITATDTATGSLTGMQAGIQVNSAATSALNVAGFPSPITAGVPGNLTVTAKDPFGNVVSGYRGTVHFTSSDPQASLPVDYTFTPAEGGTHTFTATLKTAFTQSLTATDLATLTGTQAGIVVNPAATSSLTVSLVPSPITAGVNGSLTVTAKDPFGNVAGGYRGTVHFTSSDPQAGLPANYSFIAADNGSHTFSATLKTAGNQTITTTDTTNPVLTASVPVLVTPATAALLRVGGFPSPVAAGNPQRLTVTAQDPFGNTATAYRGTIHLRSSDPQALLTYDYTFTITDNGSHPFAAVLATVGTQTLTATDTVNASITGTQSGIVVTPGRPDRFRVETSVGSTEAGTPLGATVTVLDRFDNTVTGYTGTVTFSSADPYGATLPADYTFQPSDQGVVTFAGGATLYTAGTWDVTVTDTVSGITGAAFVDVLAAPAVAFQVLAPVRVASGTPFDLTVVAVDSYGNTDTGYLGTVTFTTSDGDPGVVLPADYTFQSADAGLVTFPGGVTLITLGDQLLSVTDPVSGLTGAATVSVTAAGGPGSSPGRGAGSEPPAPAARRARIALDDWFAARVEERYGRRTWLPEVVPAPRRLAASLIDVVLLNEGDWSPFA